MSSRFIVFSLVAVLLVPLFAEAKLIYSISGLSAGGTVVSVPLPCVAGGVPALYMLIRSARATDYNLVEPYIWLLSPTPTSPTPPTKTGLFGPPVRIGQYILGVSGLPAVCFVGPTPFFGFLWHAIGTGNPVSTSI